MKCKKCGSRAINEHLHGRKKGVDLDLCDVCYWRKRYEELKGIDINKELEQIAKWGRSNPGCGYSCAMKIDKLIRKTNRN